jgi:glycosyltransferase involved in cell wall biosynthesis
MPVLSVLICTRTRPAKALRAVQSVLANDFSDFELIVVDQTPDNSTQNALATVKDARLRYIRTHTVGVAISRNIAIRAARADIVVFTDDDCICDSGWLAAINAEFNADREVMGVYGRVIPFGTVGKDGWDCVNQFGDMICPAVIQSTARLVLQSPAIPYLTLGAGNNMSFRKEAFHRVGLFLESLGPGSKIGTGEDLEFTYRLLWRRCRLVYSPKPLVEHDNWLDAAAFTRMMKVAVRVQAAVFGAYALRLDMVAATHLARIVWSLVRNRLATGSAGAGLTWFAWGLMSAPRYRVERPPIVYHSKEVEVLRLVL